MFKGLVGKFQPSEHHRFTVDGKVYSRIYHYHIRKSGGTTLNHAFCTLAYNEEEVDLNETYGLPIESEDMYPGRATYMKINRTKDHSYTGNGYTIINDNIELVKEGKFFYSASHAPMHKVKLPKGAFTFTCMRDPVRRLISDYRFHLEIKKGGFAPAYNWGGTSKASSAKA